MTGANSETRSPGARSRPPAPIPAPLGLPQRGFRGVPTTTKTSDDGHSPKITDDQIRDLLAAAEKRNDSYTVRAARDALRGCAGSRLACEMCL